MTDESKCSGNPLELLIPDLVNKSVFESSDYNVWCPSPIRSADGQYHLFHSRWPKSKGFDAWVTHSRICRAESDSPLGPWRECGEVFDNDCRDTMGDDTVGYNAHVVDVGGIYFLYYTSTQGSGYWSKNQGKPRMAHPEWWYNRNNQRVRVATAPHPRGPWKRVDSAVIDPPAGYRLTATPYFMARPDGRFQLVFKAVRDEGGARGSNVRHFVALADNPLGPFRVIDEPMISNTKTDFPIDDHCQWFQEGKYWTLAKDHGEGFAGITPCLLLFESVDGLRWKPCKPYFYIPFQLNWTDGTRTRFERLEMPKFLFRNGYPEVLYLAAKPQGCEDSFCLMIALGNENDTVTH